MYTYIDINGEFLPRGRPRGRAGRARPARSDDGLPRSHDDLDPIEETLACESCILYEFVILL